LAELSRIETVIVLQTLDLFAACSAEQILRISGIAKQRTYKSGEIIYRANEPAGALLCVVRGEVSLQGNSSGDPVIGPLETFGVIEILSGRLRICDAVAQTETLVLAIEAEDFFDLLAHNIEIVKALFRTLLQDRAEGAEQEVGKR